MKRYDIEGHDFDIEECKNGYWISYEDFEYFISTRIEELKQQRLLLGNSIDMDNELRVRIKELNNLIR